MFSGQGVLNTGPGRGFGDPKTKISKTTPCKVADYRRQRAGMVEFLAVTCYALSVATTPKKAKPRTPQQRMASRRERLRAQGLRPVQHWVPDLRDPKVLADIRRQAKLMAQHPENDVLDDWLDAIRDPKDWS
jgi:hypothetical protein